MKDYESKLRAIEKIADSKTAKVLILDFRNGKYYKSGTDIEVDIDSIKADAVIIDDIPDTPPAPPDERGCDDGRKENNR